MTPAVAPRQNGARAYGVALAVSVAQLVIMGTFVSYPVFLTPMGDDATLGRPSQTSLSIAQSVAMGVSAVLGVVAGWLCDRFGTRPVVASAGLSLGAALLLTPLAHSMAALFLCYGGCMGIAVAAISAPGPAVIGSWFADDRVSFGMGIGEAGVAIGVSVMPLAAAVLLDAHGGDWRVAMRWLGAFAAVPLVLSVFLARRDDVDAASDSDVQHGDERRDAKHDRSGVVVSSAHSSSSQVVEAVVNRDDEGHADEKQQPLDDATAVVDLAAQLGTRQFVALFLGQLLFGVAMFGFVFVGIPLARIHGRANTTYADNAPIDQKRAAALFTCYGVASAIGALALGAAASRLNSRVVFVVSCCANAACTAACAGATSYAELAVLYSAIGFFYAGGLATLPSMVVEAFAGPNLTTIMAFSFSGFTIGGVVGPPLLSALQESSPGKSYTRSLVVDAGALLLAVAVVGLACGLRCACADATKGEKKQGESRPLLAPAGAVVAADAPASG